MMLLLTRTSYNKFFMPATDRGRMETAMEELLTILEDVRDDIDFSKTHDLMSGKVLTSFDIIQLISTLDDEYDISIPAAEIVPANFDSAEAVYALIQRLKG